MCSPRGLTRYGLHAILRPTTGSHMPSQKLSRSSSTPGRCIARRRRAHRDCCPAFATATRLAWHGYESASAAALEGFPSGTFETTGGGSYEPTSRGDGWYDPRTSRWTRASSSGGSLSGRGVFAARFQPAPVMPLRASIELGGWVSVSRLASLEEHCLLVHVSKLESVKRLLAQAGDGVTEVCQVADLPSHWRVIRGVRVTDESGTRDPAIARVTPRVGLTARLEGGLEF